MNHKFKVNDIVLYQNGTTFELGVVKECLTINNEPHYRVWYHTGDTAATTSEDLLHRLRNDYAFLILRRTVSTESPETPARRLANNILTALHDLVDSNFGERLFTEYEKDPDVFEEYPGLIGDKDFYEDIITKSINGWQK